MSVRRGVAALSSLALFSGCMNFGNSPAPSPQRFQINYSLENTPPQSHFPVTLRISPLTTDGLYARDRIVVRTGKNRVDHYEYRRWATKPARMIFDLLQRDLAASGVFRAVISGASPVANDLLLSGVVERIEEIDTDGCSASLKIRFLFSRTPSIGVDVPLLQKAYEASETCRTNDVEDFVAAMSRSLANISKRLLRDIETILSEPAP